MKRLILALAIITVAFSGCAEKAPSSELIKTALNHSAANLSSYSFTISDNQTGTIKDLVKNNITNSYNTTSRSDNTEVTAFIDLTGRKAEANVSTTTIIKGPTGSPILGTSESTEYNVGNITYVFQNGNWTRLNAPESAEAIWASGSFDIVKSRAASINKTQADVIGSESIDGKDCYKLRLILDNQTYLGTEYNLLVRALYPFVPEANQTDLLKSSKNENLVWVEKDNNLLKKYQHTMNLQTTPSIAGIVDTNGGIQKLNQTMKLVEVTISSDSIETYTDYNKPGVIIVPKAALNATLVVPTTTQQEQQKPSESERASSELRALQERVNNENTNVHIIEPLSVSTNVSTGEVVQITIRYKLNPQIQVTNAVENAEIPTILNAYIGLVKEDPNIGDLEAHVLSSEGKQLGYYVCKKEWIQELNNGKLSLEELRNEVMQTWKSGEGGTRSLKFNGTYTNTTTGAQSEINIADLMATSKSG